MPEAAVRCLVFIDVGNYMDHLIQEKEQKSEDIKLISGTAPLTGA